MSSCGRRHRSRRRKCFTWCTCTVKLFCSCQVVAGTAPGKLPPSKTLQVRNTKQGHLGLLYRLVLAFYTVICGDPQKQEQSELRVSDSASFFCVAKEMSPRPHLRPEVLRAMLSPSVARGRAKHTPLIITRSQWDEQIKRCRWR